ncbi:hypothetical protein C8R46DRAFT_1219448 [Mycena filopes]|nr:hypothetical protein C8R46DRAFT_1219448 [Mycena filopes]
MQFPTALILLVCVAVALFSVLQVGAAPLIRRNTTNPGTMKGYLQLRGSGVSSDSFEAAS